MSATKNNTGTDGEGWVQAKSKRTGPNKTWSIDRKQPPRKQTNGNRVVHKKVVKEKIPDVVADMLVNEFLTLVGDSDWNDPANVAKTIANMMSIDLSKPVDGQVPQPVEIDRTVFVPASKGSDVPYWICQSIIRVDEKFGHRFINYKGAKYNKIDIVFESEHFKKRMDQVARAAHCKWNARWGNARKEENRLYQKTRTGAQSDESWLDRCVKHLLTDADTEGINIKNLIMLEFKRDLDLPRNPPQVQVSKIETKAPTVSVPAETPDGPAEQVAEVEGEGEGEAEEPENDGEAEEPEDDGEAEEEAEDDDGEVEDAEDAEDAEDE